MVPPFCFSTVITYGSSNDRGREHARRSAGTHHPGLDQACDVTALPLLNSQGSAHPSMRPSESTHSIQQIFITHLLCDRHCARCWGVLKCTKDFGFNSGSVRPTDQAMTAPKRQFLTPVSKSYRFHLDAVEYYTAIKREPATNTRNDMDESWRR